MTVNDASATIEVEVATAGRPLPGQETSGDLAAIVPYEGGTLVAIADGLGHGPHAALAAHAAMEVVRSQPGSDLVTLVRSCHLGARATRGAVLAVVAFEVREHRLTWVSIGNIQMVIAPTDPDQADTKGAPAAPSARSSGVSASTLGRTSPLAWSGAGALTSTPPGSGRAPLLISLMAQPGVVGYRLPTPVRRHVPLTVGDMVVMATDGVRHSFRAEVRPERTAEDVVQAVVANHLHPGDDALVVAARVVAT